MNIRRKRINLKKIYVILAALTLASLFFISTLVIGNVKAQTSVDLASNKPIVSISSTAAGSNPAFVNDGNPTTYWTSAGGGTQWISIDLGTSNYIGTVVVKWGTDTATNYEIDFSDDGVGYAPVWSGINGDFNSSIGRTGRYVRIMTTTGTNPAQYQLGTLGVYAGTIPTSTPIPIPTPTGSLSPSPTSTPTFTPISSPTSSPSSTSSSGLPTPTSTPISTNTPTSTPTATPTPCTISSVSWPQGITSVVEGTNINISVTASGNCSSKQVHLTARRQVAILPDADAMNQPNPRDVTLTLTGNTATASATWRSDTWTNACTLTTCNPTFFVRGNIVGETAEVTTDRNNDLIVTQSQVIPTDPNDWPQVQKDPQHTGYSSETLGTNFKVKFTYPFQPDKVYPQTQAIVYRGKIFVGTEGANGQKPTLYAIDAVNAAPLTNPPKGIVLWKFEAGGPIVNSAATDNGKVFFGSLDGAAYAIFTDSENGHQQGTLAWKNQLSIDRGFSTAPVIADNKIMLGGRDGNFYALDPNDGHVIWKYNANAPLFQTAAYDQGKVFFGSMDMYVHALNTADGSLAWKSVKLKGIAMKDYWPLIYQGKVFIRPWADYADYSKSPKGPSFYSLDESTGVIDTFLTGVVSADNTMNGATPPPCVDRDGKLVVTAAAIGGTWHSGWGRLDLITKAIQPISTYSPSFGWGNPDENMNVTCSQNLIFTIHTQEANAQYTGAYNIDTATWTRIGQGIKNRQMANNTQGGGGNPASISNGMLYHVSWHELIVRTTN